MSIELLEDRLMLDAGASSQIPAAIVVGRTLATAGTSTPAPSYFVGEVQNNQVTITYTVYNEQADTETGVLLTTTLEPGVTLLGSSVTLDGTTTAQLPDQSGQNLAWSLQPIQGYDRESVAVTVSLANPIPLQLDTGAHAYATLDAGAVSASTPAATLRAGNVSDPALLASTPDANTTDPFVQEEAAALNYDPTQIFNFLHTQIGYNSYLGSVRGARGTLWSNAGNALDVASLGVALMRASGVPAQYVSGTLSYGQAQTLILSMFPASYQTVGYIPSGTTTSDPADDSQLLSETESHYWFQFDTGSGMQDADPLMAGAVIGKAFTTSTGTFADVPDDLREKTEIKLSAEMYSQASALFGAGNGLPTTTVLDQTFNDVDLVGRPLTLGHFVSSSSFGAIFTSTTNTYTPYLNQSDQAFPNGPGEVTEGTPYQEVLTNFPLGSQILTGVFLNITLSGPQGAPESLDRTLFDRIGYAQRQGLAPVSVSASAGGLPAFSTFDAFTISVNPSLQDPAVGARLYDVVQAASAGATSTDANVQSTFLRTEIPASNQLVATTYMAMSDQMTAQAASSALVKAYFDRPRVIIVSTRLEPTSDGKSEQLVSSIDLRRDSIRAIAYPGQNPQAIIDFNTVRGMENSYLESIAFPTTSGSTPVSAYAVFNAASDQGISIVQIAQSNLTDLDALDISAEAKARITTAVQGGSIVYVPAQSVQLNGQSTIAWYESNPTTGEIVGVTEDGGHQALAGWGAAFLSAYGLLSTVLPGLDGLVGGTIDGLLLDALYSLNKLLASAAYIVTQSPYEDPAAFFKAAYKKIESDVAKMPFLSAKDKETFNIAFEAVLFPQIKDPPIPASWVGVSGIFPGRKDQSYTPLSVAANGPSGPVSGSLRTASAAFNGQLAASWSTTDQTGFNVTSLNASGTTIRNSEGSLVGTGVLELDSPSGTAITISGNGAYAVNGQGTLAFYGPAETSLGVSGNWDQYSATVSGGLTIALTVATGVLTLNGTALPAGTYSFSANSASLAGAGQTSSPNLAGSAIVSLTGGSAELAPGTGGVSVGGQPADSNSGLTLNGFSGTFDVSANGDQTDSIAIHGNAAVAISVSANPPSLTTDQNTPGTFQVGVNSSFADTYNLSVVAPPGWTAAIDDTGKVLVTPAPGLQGGTYPVSVVAQSTANPNLFAQRTILVTVTPTQPGIQMSIVSDTVYSVPVNGALLPTAFRASIQNLGPTPDTYNVTSSNIPSGFTLVNSGTSVTVPAGQTGILGLYLQPNSGQPLPPPGTVLSFDVTATSTTDAKITKTQTVSFTVPAIDAITITGGPTSVNTTPAVAATDTLTITNVGNVPESAVTLSATSSSGLSLSGLAPLSLAAGQSKTETITLTPTAATPLNSILGSTITATYGPASSPQTQTLNMAVDVVVPGAAAIANAAVAAQQLNNSGLEGRLQDLSTALTNLVQNPTSAVYKGQALANLDSLISQLTNDPFLSGFTSGLTAAQAALSAAVTAADIQTAVSNLGTALDSLAQVITDDAAHNFTLSLSLDRNIVQSSAPEVFGIIMTNNGTAATTYDLSVSGLPAGVTASFSQPSVTLQPGQSLTAGNNAVTLTLTESGDTLVPANFNVTATAEGATEITQSTPGLLTLRDTSIVATGIVTNPAFTNPGGQVDVSAQILGTINQPTQISAYYTVTDPTGKVLFTSTAVPVALTVTSGLITADLGNLDTTGFADGVDTITVTLLDSTGKPIPGGSTSTSYLIGQPVTGTLSTTPTTVPTGSDTVTTTLSVTTQSTYPSPLTLQGAVATPAPGTSVALYKSGNSTYAYESGTGGINVINVTDPSNPQLVETFGQGDIVNGKFGFNVARVVGNELLVGTSNGNNGSVFNLLVYSLATPAAPQLVSNTTINYRFLSDLLVNSTGTAAFVPTNGFFYSGSTIFQDFGDFVAIDLTNPTQPALASALFTNEGQPDGGDMNQFGGVLVNDQIAYSAGLTPGGGTVIGNTGNLLVVNIADPKNMSLITQLKIPGTINILDVAVHGNRALVVGTAGTESNIYNPNATGVVNHLTLTVLDITDPSNPQILGSTFVTNEQFPVNEAGAKTDVVDLGNGDFAVSDTDEGGNPALLVVDPSNPNNIIVSAAQVPSGVHGITVSGDTLYATTSNGLSIYQIGQLVSDPVTITATLPPGTAANIPASSFNIPPTQITTGTTADTLTWDRSFSAGDTTFTFTWQTKVSGIQAGQATPVTQGATVSYVAQGTPGTLSLPGTTVTGTSIISLTPASATEQPGGTATYDLRLYNPAAAQVIYTVNIPDLPYYVHSSLASVSVPAGGTVDTPLVLTSNLSALPGNNPFTVTADGVLYSSDLQTQLGEFTGSASSSLTIAGPPVVQPNPNAQGVVVSLGPTRAVAGQGTSASYVVQLTNVGSLDDQFNLSVNGLPAGITATFGVNPFDLDVPPGASNSRSVTLTLDAGSGSAPGDIPFTVTADSVSTPTVQGTAQGTLSVVSSGVAVGLSPLSTQPGGGLQLTVTNTGTQQDRFNLALGGPAALVSKLATSAVTLAAGATQVIPITTTAVDFALPGSLGLTAIATSQNSPDVMQGASANLTIPVITGMTAQFSPAAMTVVAPGTTTFLLQVNNTGNSEDEYSATIIGTTGPVTASLVGLDGLPTQSMALFRLPALSTGALSLQATVTGPGQGTVTVLVRSLSTGQETTIVASISGQSISTDGPRVTLVQRYGIHMMPTTIVLTFDQPLDPTRAQDVQQYHLVDPQGHAVPITSAVYDPVTNTVTLHPRYRINLHHSYKLTVDGASPSGLTSSSGLLLDGKDSGNPGTNYVATINWRDLVLPPNWNPKWSRNPDPGKDRESAKKLDSAVITGHHRLFQRSSTLVKGGSAKVAEARLVPSLHKPTAPRRGQESKHLH